MQRKVKPARNLIEKVTMFLLFFTVNIHATLNNFYNVIDYGVDKTGTKKSTSGINTLIQTVAQKGGGTIYFPAGNYLTGAIRLESNITVFIEAGAIIKFSDNFDDYLPMVQSRWEGVDIINFSPLFYAYEAENITITGRGTIDGQGMKWWDFHHELYKKATDSLSKWQVEFLEKNRGMLMPDNPEMFERGFCRPPFIQPMYCKNVRIEGIRIINSPFWTVNPEFCENVTITGITIENPKSPNTDGINPESCKNVHISDCHISVGDDCITIKSGKDLPGRTKSAAAENYTITNCTMLSGHGGVVIGSEMSGDVRNIVISNCIFDGTDRGIRIKSTRGRGGVVEGIRVSNIIMRNIKMEAVTLNLFYTKSEPEPVSDRTPTFRNIHISNITGNAAKAITLTGLEEMPIKNISFTDINLVTVTGVSIERSEDISLHHVRIDNSQGPALIFNDCSQIEIDGFSSSMPVAGEALISMKNVKQAYIHDCYQPVRTDIFIKLEGAGTDRIILGKDNAIQSVKLSELSSEVTASALKMLE
jgi:polygalacturonase